MNAIDSVEKFYDLLTGMRKVDIELLRTTEFGRKTIEIITEACAKRYVICKTAKQYLATIEKGFEEGDCRGQASAFLIAVRQDFNNSADMVVDQLCFQILDGLSTGLKFAINNRRLDRLNEKVHGRDRKQIEKQFLRHKNNPQAVTELTKYKLELRRSRVDWNRIINADKKDLIRDHGISSIPESLVKPFKSFSKRIERVVHMEIAKRARSKFIGVETLQSKRVSKHLNKLAHTIHKSTAILFSISSLDDSDLIGHCILGIFSPKSGPCLLYDSNKGGYEANDAPSLISFIEDNYIKGVSRGKFELEEFVLK